MWPGTSVLKNLCAVLKEAGATPAQVVPYRLPADLGSKPSMASMRRSLVKGSAQPGPAFKWQRYQGARVEIDCVAWLGN